MELSVRSAFVGLAVVGLQALAPGVRAEPASEAALGACFEAQARAAPFSGVVLATQGDSRFYRTAGNVSGATPPTADTPYRLASVGKLFTQVAIGQLIDQRKVDLQAPVGTYVAGLPPEIAAVTIDQLLHHRSGVARNVMFDPASLDVMLQARSARDLLPLVVSQPPAFPPGSKTEYSNGGYFLLGVVIEQVSGLSYEAYLREKIFGPLGMTRSAVAAGPGTAARLSRMSETPAPFIGLPDVPGTPAGGSVSTAADMARLARALMGDEMLSQAARQALYPPKSDVWRIGQGGGAPGENTWFMVYPVAGAAVVVLTNQDPPGGELLGETMGTLLATGVCRPLSAADRPSPMRIMRGPPTPGGPPGRP
jgi:CubicO group peptidase (beta-lactamase class C family)